MTVDDSSNWSKQADVCTMVKVKYIPQMTFNHIVIEAMNLGFRGTPFANETLQLRSSCAGHADYSTDRFLHRLLLLISIGFIWHSELTQEINYCHLRTD
jgi:hypothetical protein